MIHPEKANPSSINRRTFLVASGLGVSALSHNTSTFATVGSAKPRTKPAKSTILFFLCGGASHIDTWDMKPNDSYDYRGPFKPIATKSSDIQLCEHLPLTAKQAHHLSVIQGVTDGGRATGDHHAGYYYNLTGHVPDQTFKTQGNDRRPYPDDWPFMGSVVGSRRKQHPSLPQVITLPHKPSRAPYTRPGQFSARLGIEHDPFYLQRKPNSPLDFYAPSLTLQGGLTEQRVQDRKTLLKSLDSAHRDLEREFQVKNFSKQQKKAFELLASSSATKALDLSLEKESTRERYGKTINGMSLLMARRLVEAEVPFITIFWKGNENLKKKCRSAGSWDTHGNNFNCLKDNLLPEFDQGFSALLEDLAQRNLLEDTLVLVSSEMGRQPKIGDRRSGGVQGAGRDHWTACMSVLMAGGGTQGGQVFGETDQHAEYPKHHSVDPADIVKTVYYSMGVNDLTENDAQGRPFNLLETGKPILDLF